jgi:hemerythrin
MKMENLLNWKDQYSIGISRVDMEHKIFLDLIRCLKQEVDNQIEEERFFDLVNEIEKYAEFHFTSEENFMKKISYPKLDKHKELHFNLLEKLNIVKHKIISKDDFIKFLEEWFVSHTAHEDKKIEEYCLSAHLEIDFKFHIDGE